MGIDLWIAITATVSLAIAAYLFGVECFRGKRGSDSNLVFSCSLLLALTFGFHYAGNLAWAIWIPDSAVLYWSNVMPIVLGFSAGMATHTPGLTRWHRPLTTCLLGCLATGYVVSPILRPFVAPAAVASTSKWQDEICLQSHEASCAPAAAATLLRLSGVAADEQRMATQCLTSAHGTMPLALYRGLAIEASAARRDARVAASDPSHWLALRQLPNVALVKFQYSPSTTSYSRLLGPQGEGHAVVVLGRTDAGRWIIGDPAIGRVCWTDEELRSRFTGEAIYVARIF